LEVNTCFDDVGDQAEFICRCLGRCLSKCLNFFTNPSENSNKKQSKNCFNLNKKFFNFPFYFEDVFQKNPF
jgi:hypothetical protein